MVGSIGYSRTTVADVHKYDNVPKLQVLFPYQGIRNVCQKVRRRKPPLIRLHQTWGWPTPMLTCIINGQVLRAEAASSSILYISLTG